MKHNFLISVIIAAYNASNFLRYTVVSVLSQTYKNLEIIIVDDGSTDETFKVVQQLQSEYSPDKIFYIYQKNKGPAAARNQGIHASRGKYIAIIDADDIWDSKKLERQVLEITDPENDIILSSMVRFHGKFEDKNFFNQTDPPAFTTQEEYFRSLIGLSNMHMANFATILVPRTVILDAGCYDEYLITAEDWDLWLRIAKNLNSNFKNIYIPLVYYRKYDASLTIKHDYIKTLKNQIFILEKYLSCNNLDSIHVKKAMIDKIDYFLNVAISRSDRFAAVSILILYFKFGLYNMKCVIFFIKSILRIILMNKR